jgi:hypothetical protein
MGLGYLSCLFSYLFTIELTKKPSSKSSRYFERVPTTDKKIGYDVW